MAVEKKREPSISELEGKGLNKVRDAASEELQRIREKQSYSIDAFRRTGDEEWLEQALSATSSIAPVVITIKAQEDGRSGGAAKTNAKYARAKERVVAQAKLMLPHATSKDAALRSLHADLVHWKTTQSEKVHIPNMETMWEWLKAEQKAGRMEIPRNLQEPGRRGISPER